MSLFGELELAPSKHQEDGPACIVCRCRRRQLDPGLKICTDCAANRFCVAEALRRLGR